MATWKPGRTKATPLAKAPPKIRKKGAPALKPPTASKPKAAKPKASPAGGAPAAPGAAAGGKPWYDPAVVAARDATLASSFDDPLKPMTGAAALEFARAAVAAQTAPVMQSYDRQQAMVQSRAADQSVRQAAGTASARDQFLGQIAAQAAAQDKARGQITGAGQQLTAAVDQGAAQAAQAVSADANLRGAGLDGGAAAAAAQEASSAKARAAAGTQIALDSQASQALGGNQLLQQIAAATTQQGGERQGAITQAANTQFRDLNEGRAKDMSAAQSNFIKTLTDLQSTGVQTKLATETLGLNTAKATADSQIAAAKLDLTAKIAEVNAKIRTTEGAANRAARKELQTLSTQSAALDRASREGIAAAGQEGQDRRAAAAAKAKGKKEKETGAKLTPQDKARRSLITNVKVASDSGQLASIKKQAKNASEYRKLLAEKLDVGDAFSRQLLADLAYGGLRPGTVNAYKAKYGRNPPSSWARFKAKKSGVANGAAQSVADALSSVGK